MQWGRWDTKAWQIKWIHTHYIPSYTKRRVHTQDKSRDGNLPQNEYTLKTIQQRNAVTTAYVWNTRDLAHRVRRQNIGTQHPIVNALSNSGGRRRHAPSLQVWDQSMHCFRHDHILTAGTMQRGRWDTKAWQIKWIYTHYILSYTNFAFLYHARFGGTPQVCAYGIRVRAASRS